MKNLWLFEARRLAILHALLSCRSARCRDLRRRLRMRKNLLSYHLGILRTKGILEEEAGRGREKRYRIRPGMRPFAEKAVAIAG